MAYHGGLTSRQSLVVLGHDMININKDFVLGGHAVFTVQNDTTGEHRTYKVKVSKPNPRFPNPAYFVGLLSGPDNVNSYQYIGMLNADNGAVTLTRNSRMTDDCKAVKGIRWTLAKIWNNLPIPDGIQIRHEGRCGCCGRTLTEPESLDRGIGPICWARLTGGR